MVLLERALSELRREQIQEAQLRLNVEARPRRDIILKGIFEDSLTLLRTHGLSRQADWNSVPIVAGLEKFLLRGVQQNQKKLLVEVDHEEQPITISFSGDVNPKTSSVSIKISGLEEWFYAFAHRDLLSGPRYLIYTKVNNAYRPKNDIDVTLEEVNQWREVVDIVQQKLQTAST